MKWTRRLAASLRQRLYPEEFRLPEADFGEEQLDLLEELIQMIQPTLCQADAAQKQDKRQMARFLADLGTGIWRIRKKVEGLKRMPKELKEALFALESTWDSMSQGGVEIVDHVGEVPLGMVPRVVRTEDVPGLEREQVVEALSPTILLRGEVVQVGEVVLGRPAPLVPVPGEEASHG
ncbi:conserved hypothetical protein [Aminomonas paucivorans DSM 12260]|uniref:Uncharacterized protein n=1 Tax=Aminomonas paucivorans DSM 12260 TaxID=584708 RepID=E3CZ16_9BACT|nr:hypothetical protein [Aminomonas paucivorans]EFQ22789.1 conserved hypothetical protein [Aminomonas paucivorans DSM 12260]